MEVHPPEHPIFTWKQFFIHMGTIVLGLLIAIGLEQTVEYFHRQHQRHQLEEDLRAEGIRNLRNALDGASYLSANLRWQTMQALELDRAETEGRVPVYIPRPPVDGRIHAHPADSVWTVAQSGATLTLLPRSEAERFAHPYWNIKLINDEVVLLNIAFAQRLDALASSSSEPESEPMPAQATYDLSRLSKANLGRFREAVGQVIVHSRVELSYELNLYALVWGTLKDHSDEENVQLMTDLRTAFYKEGGVDGIAKRYPIPAK